MAGHGPALEVQLDEGVAGVQFQALAHVLMRHRVMMLLVLDVIVDVDLHGLDVDVLIRLSGQGAQHGLIQLFERLAPVARQLLEGALVQVRQ